MQETAEQPRRRIAQVVSIYALTGAVCLVYEVIALRLLRLELGSTTYATTAVLCTFMGGMAVGSAVASSRADRSLRPLRTYAFLTLGAAMSFALFPFVLAAVRPLFPALYALGDRGGRWLVAAPFLVSVLILFIPCVMMGATLPFVVRAVARGPERGAAVSVLYGANALGASAGALAAGFIMIPSLGVGRSLVLACVAGTGAGLAALAADLAGGRAAAGPRAVFSGTGAGRANGKRPAGAQNEGRAAAVTAAAYAAAGAAAMIYEVAWTRALAAMIGSSVYAFSLMLGAFVLGLSSGSLIAARFIALARSPVAALAAAMAGIGAAAMAAVPLFNILPVWFLRWVAPQVASFWWVQFVSLGLAFLVMLVPTLLMGAAFPLAYRAMLDAGIPPGRSAGVVSAVNTAGNVAGALAGGLVLVPALGLQNAVYSGVALNTASACALLLAARPLRRRTALAVCLAGAMAAAMISAPRWSVSSMTFGPLIRAVRHAGSGDMPPSALNDGLETLYHREGLGAAITVKQTPTRERVLFVGGKPDASTAGDLPTQTMIAHLPLLVHPAPRDMLVIGLASGITLGSAGRHPLETLDCVEIEPAMEDACRFFDNFNHRILDDPRVELIIADGRRYLDVSRKLYDVIVSQPTNPWIAGMGDLFTVEFFRKCRARLRDGGMTCVWVDSYTLSPDAFRGVVAAFGSVFPHVQIWSFLRSDYVLLGSGVPFSVPAERVAGRMRGPAGADIARALRPSLPDFVANFVAGDRGAAALARDARLNTDDNAAVEFSAPRSMLDPEIRYGVLAAVEAARETGFDFIEAGPGSETARARCSSLAEARGLVMRAALADHGGRSGESAALLRRAAALNPDDPFLLRSMRARMKRAAALLAAGGGAGAEELYRSVLSALPDDPAAMYGLACALGGQGLAAEAWQWYARAAEGCPTNAAYLAAYAAASYDLRKGADAVRGYRAALSLEPDSPPALNNLAWLLASIADPSLRNVPEAVAMAERACGLTGWRDEHIVETLARIYLLASRHEDAVSVWDRAMAAAPADSRVRLAARRAAFATAAERLTRGRTSGAIP